MKFKFGEVFFFLLMLLGIVMWALALISAIFCIDTHTIFFLLLGGQLVKLGYNYGDCKSEAEWQEKIIDILQNFIKKV